MQWQTDGRRLPLIELLLELQNESPAGSFCLRPEHLSDDELRSSHSATCAKPQPSRLGSRSVELWDHTSAIPSRERLGRQAEDRSSGRILDHGYFYYSKVWHCKKLSGNCKHIITQMFLSVSNFYQCKIVHRLLIRIMLLYATNRVNYILYVQKVLTHFI